MLPARRVTPPPPRTLQYPILPHFILPLVGELQESPIPECALLSMQVFWPVFTAPAVGQWIPPPPACEA